MHIHVNGIDIFCQISGSGRPLLLVHGNGEDHSIFDEGIEILRDRFTCIVIDSRGHGRSTAVNELHYQDMADDVTAILEELDLKDVLFYGFSDGGIIGLLAAMNTDRITTLVTSGANVSPDGVKPWLKYILKITDFVRPDAKTRLMLKEPHITSSDLSSIKAKTLVLAGENDLVTDKETRFIAGNIPGSQLHFIKGEGHGSYIVHSTAFVRYLVYADKYLR